MILSYVISFVEYSILGRLLKLEDFLGEHYHYGYDDHDRLGLWMDMPADGPDNLPKYEIRKGVRDEGQGRKGHYITFRHKRLFVWVVIYRSSTVEQPAI